MAKKNNDGSSPIIIKKYANRRLYNTDTSAYITLDDLAKMTRDGREFQVLDAKSNEDITHNVLTQIIMDEEARGTTMLPVNFLRQLISMYGDQMQSVVPQYLEASLDQLHRNQSQLRETMAGAFAVNPFAEMARRNMEMFTAAATGGRAATADDAPAATEAAKPGAEDLAALKAQLAELQKKLDKLSG